MTEIGATAERPRDIGPKGWWQVLLRVKDELAADRVSLVAAGVAFYALMALFPAITAIIALGGLVFDPADVTAQIDQISGILPKDAAALVVERAKSVAGSEETGLGLAALLGLAIALYSASKGVSTLMVALNVAYDETESRGFLARTALVFGLTGLLVLGVIFSLAAVLALPAILDLLALGPTTELLIALGRWVLLVVLTIAGIATLYRFGPDRRNAEWRWVLPGALVACLLWILGSAGFAFYAETYGSYDETFGTMAGAIVLLLWLWISAYVVLIGAELNAEAEAQTRRDSTIGGEQPRGERGAVKADAFDADL